MTKIIYIKNLLIFILNQEYIDQFFTPKSELNKDISDISKKYSQQISQKKKEKAKLKIIPKTDEKKFVIKPRNLKAKLFSNSKNKIYNSLI